MKNNIFGKGLVCGIIVLFLSMSLIPLAGSTLTNGSSDDCFPIFEPTVNNGWVIRANISFQYDPAIVLEIKYKSDGVWIPYEGKFTVKYEDDLRPLTYCYKTVNSGGAWIDGSWNYSNVPLDWTPPYLVVNRDLRLFNRIQFSAYVRDEASGMDRVEFWIGPYWQYTVPLLDQTWQQLAVWTAQDVHLNIAVTVKAYDVAGNVAIEESGFSKSLPASQRLSQNLQITQLLHNLIYNLILHHQMISR